MMPPRLMIAAAIVASVATRAAAQPAQAGTAQPAQPGAQQPGAARSAGEQPAGEQPDAGYIGREITRLEIDDCKPIDLSKDEVFKQGAEHFDRGEILYSQGDYEGAVRELVYSYCLVPSFY